MFTSVYLWVTENAKDEKTKIVSQSKCAFLSWNKPSTEKICKHEREITEISNIQKS